MIKLFNYDIRTSITNRYIALIFLFLISLTYFIITNISYSNKYSSDLNLDLNSILLTVITFIVLILYITFIPEKHFKLVSLLILPLSLHILITYGKKYPGTIKILRNKENNPIYEEKTVRNIAIFGTFTSIIGILIGVLLRLKLI